MRIGRMMALLALVVGCRSQPAAEPAPVHTEQAKQAAVRVDVWHDTICPWCRIGLHNLDSVVASWDGPPVEVVHHAFLLEPDMPAEGADMRERLGRKYGAERLEAMFQRVTQAGAQYGVHFDFSKVRRSPQTAPSHALIEWAPQEKRSALIAAIHRAHFEEGRDIGDAGVLGGIAASVGLDAGAARAAVTDPSRLAAIRADAANAGIHGVPHFVIGGQVLEGAQSPEALRRALLAAAAR